MSQSVPEHCREIERCNQRGGRMLSIVDLLAAGTLDLEVAAYLAAAIGDGASFLVGANPGGAGKTTVMGALLNFLPPGRRLVPAVEWDPALPAGQACLLCHEISPGPYFCYLWGESARRYFVAARLEAQLAANLHADDRDECRLQLVEELGVAEGDFCRVPLLVFLSLNGGRRRIASVWESDGRAEHVQLVRENEGAWQWLAPARRVEPAQLQRARAFLERLESAGAQSIQDVRAAWIRERAAP